MDPWRRPAGVILLLLLVGTCLPLAAAPRLILMITVDQLRGDMPRRFEGRFPPGGFRYLFDHGIDFASTYYRHATTYTAVGHATLATGGNVPEHGLAGNNWYDHQRHQRVYCVEDPDHPILGGEPRPHQGSSPRNLTASTFGDQLVTATAGGSRVFSASFKDRGAILPGGHLGKAFWYDTPSGRFVTSHYYYPRNPAWLDAWNDSDPTAAYRGSAWTLRQPRQRYRFGGRDQRPGEGGYKGLGRVFPHRLAAHKDRYFFGQLRFTPMADQLLLDFARHLLTAERLGQGKDPDVLALSLSATDYIGHAYGPGSLEAEDNLLRLDRTLAALFQAVDRQVGLDHTLIVLSSDHGIAPIPEVQARLGFDAGRHHPPAFVDTLNQQLQNRYGGARELIVGYWGPSLYLDTQLIAQRGLDLPSIEAEAARYLQALPGIARAISRTELLRDRASDDPIRRKLQRSFHPKRSGNVLFVQEPYWFLSPAPGLYSANHGSPYNYDTYVPLLLAGPGIPHRRVFRTVAPRDLAVTLTTYLGILPPSGSVGTPLREALPQSP